MLRLIQSGERIGADGRVTQTRASETKKQDERETAVDAFRKAHEQVHSAIEDLVCDTLLMKSTVKRRLYNHFGLNHAGNASRRPLPEVKQETEILSELLKELRNESGAWNEEFRRLHVVRTHHDTLVNMGAPFRVEAIQAVLHNLGRLPTADWEADTQESRLELLRRLCDELPGLVKAERDARQAEQQRRNLEASRQGASAACSRLAETFHHSAVEDRSERGYREFIVAACELGGYSSGQLIPELFLSPENIDAEAMGHRIRSIADKIRVQLGSAHPPPWMQSFFPARKVYTPQGGEHTKPQFQPSTEPTPAPEPEPAPVSRRALTQTPRGGKSPQPKPPPEPKSLSSQMGYDMNLVGKKMRDSANAIGADLPADVRCPAWTVNLIQEHLKKRVPNRIEQVDALRAVMLRLAKELIDENR